MFAVLLDVEDHLSLPGMATQHLPQPPGHLPFGYEASAQADVQGGRRPLERLDLAGHQLNRVLSPVHPTRHHHHLVDHQELLVTLGRLREDHHFHIAVQILYGQDHHPVALAGPSVAGRDDQTGDLDLGLVGAVLQLRRGCVGSRMESRGLLRQGVIGEIQPQHLLLKGEADLFVPLTVGDLRQGQIGHPTSAEQGELAGLLPAAAVHHRVDDQWQNLDESPPGVTDAVEPSTLDQRLQGVAS